MKINKEENNHSNAKKLTHSTGLQQIVERISGSKTEADEIVKRISLSKSPNKIAVSSSVSQDVLHSYVNANIEKIIRNTSVINKQMNQIRASSEIRASSDMRPSEIRSPLKKPLYKSGKISFMGEDGKVNALKDSGQNESPRKTLGPKQSLIDNMNMSVIVKGQEVSVVSEV
jgi:hypothetical protein